MTDSWIGGSGLDFTKKECLSLSRHDIQLVFWMKAMMLLLQVVFCLSRIFKNIILHGTALECLWNGEYLELEGGELKKKKKNYRIIFKKLIFCQIDIKFASSSTDG